jgi:hypothetical protein
MQKLIEFFSDSHNLIYTIWMMVAVFFYAISHHWRESARKKLDELPNHN